MLEAGVPPALMVCFCVGELLHCAVTKDSMARYGEPLFERVFFAARYFESWLNTSVLGLSLGLKVYWASISAIVFGL